MRSRVLPEVRAAEATVATTAAVLAVVRIVRRAEAVVIPPVVAVDIRALEAEATTKPEC